MEFLLNNSKPKWTAFKWIRGLFMMVLFLPSMFFSQNKEASKNEIIEKQVEYLIEDAEESNLDYTTLFDQLSYYFDHPLNLNKIEINELEDLNILTSIQIHNLLEHIKKNGNLIALEELQTVKGFDSDVIKRLLPFVKISASANQRRVPFKTLFHQGKHQLLMRYEKDVEEKRGYRSIVDDELSENPDSRYLGNNFSLYSRYRYQYGNQISIGFTTQKDKGEEFFTGTQQQGFDFYSAHFYLKDRGVIKQLAIGDYQAQFGQGLTYWSGIAFGKSAAIFSVKRNATGLKPYTSVNENQFLKGGGIALQYHQLEATAFYSYNYIDANINFSDSSSISSEVVTSIQQTGLHRTDDEINDKRAISQQQLGGHLAYKTRTLNIGLTGVQSNLGGEFNPELQPYSRFRNTGNEQTNIGLDYTVIYKNVNLFGEAAKSLNAGSAFVSGAIFSVDPRLSLTVLYRNYQRDFHPIASAGVGEGSFNENEKGTYMGFVAKPFKHITLSAYYDQFTFPWLRFGVNAPSKGFQYLAQLTYNPSKKTEIYVRIRKRNRDKNTSRDLDNGINYLVNEKQTNYRYHLSYQVSESVQLKNRVELVNYSKEESSSEMGYYIYQDIIYKKLNNPFSFSFRYGIFDTKSFNSRVYAYENDVLYSYAIPALFNKGTRTYLTIRYKLNKATDIWLRYGLTYYDNINIISSGLEEIEGNTRSDVKVQVRFKF